MIAHWVAGWMRRFADRVDGAAVHIGLYSNENPPPETVPQSNSWEPDSWIAAPGVTVVGSSETPEPEHPSGMAEVVNLLDRPRPERADPQVDGEAEVLQIGLVVKLPVDDGLNRCAECAHPVGFHSELDGDVGRCWHDDCDCAVWCPIVD